MALLDVPAKPTLQPCAGSPGNGAVVDPQNRLRPGPYLKTPKALERSDGQTALLEKGRRVSLCLNLICFGKRTPGELEEKRPKRSGARYPRRIGSLR